MAELVRLKERPSRDGRSFKYYIEFVDENGKRKRISLGHANKRKAEKQRAQLERDLKLGIVKPKSMRLSNFLKDSIERSKGQVRDSTVRETSKALRDLIGCVGNIDFRNITHDHGEKFLQYCRDNGNAPGTVSKKLRHLKRLFQLAKERRQLDDNPLQYVKQPKTPTKKVNVYSPDQCSRMIKAACEYEAEKPYFEWKLLISMALCTGMRRGELLNVTWSDIDFACMSVEVAHKDSTEHVWEWHIKDTDRRTLPLTNEVFGMLVELQSRRPDGYPYVFVPEDRYDYIQGLRKQGKWTVEHGRCPVHNFTRMFKEILKIAAISKGEFHDLRRTCLSHWLSSGLSEFEVMTLAGHSKFETTRKFYLAVNKSLVSKARDASNNGPVSQSGTHLSRTPVSDG